MAKIISVLLALMLLAVPAFAKAKDKGKPKEKPAPSVEQVSFKTSDGFTLIGEFYRGRPGAPVVLLLHQLGTDRTEFDSLAHILHEKGYNVLAYDARGHGKSTDKDGKVVTWESFDDAGFQGMTKDIDAALIFLHDKKKTPKSPVGIVGASIQSSTGLEYAFAHPEVHALVMLSPGLSYHNIDTAGPMKLYGKRPVFIAASIEDATSYKAAKELDRLAKDGKKLEILSNAGHGAGMFRKDPGLMKKVADWLSTNLK